MRSPAGTLEAARFAPLFSVLPLTRLPGSAMSNNPAPLLDFRWEMMDTMLSGKSAIDVPRLYVQSLEDASSFLDCYGYDVSKSAHRDDLEGFRTESIDFIEKELLSDEPMRIDSEVRGEKDVRKLLLWASTDAHSERQLWSCVLLRVMHTFAHAGSYFQGEYGDQIRDQILERFTPHIDRRPDGSTWLGRGPEAIPLTAFELKFTKSRYSLAMKLLQKAENVAADVFDWIGVRIVTRERFDALLAVRYIRTSNIAMFANVVPGRSRNTLIDLQQMRTEMSHMRDERRAGRMAEYEELQYLRERVIELGYPTREGTPYNPFTAVTYHSVQFTCRQLIRVSNPHLHALTRALPERPASAIRSILDRFGVQTEVRFFFPFEIQIIDEESYQGAFEGLASHATYKQRQRYAVKRRLWGDRVTELPPALTPEESEAEERLAREYVVARAVHATLQVNAVGE